MPLVIGEFGVRAMREQRLHQFEVALEHSGMQRRVADVVGVRVRAFVEEQRRHLTMTAVRGDDERAGAIGKRVVHVGAGREEQPRRLGVARPRREEQRRAAAARNGVVQLFASGSLRDFAGHRLRVLAGPGANIAASFEQRADDAADVTERPPTSAPSGCARIPWR